MISGLIYKVIQRDNSLLICETKDPLEAERRARSYAKSKEAETGKPVTILIYAVFSPILVNRVYTLPNGEIRTDFYKIEQEEA